MEFLHEKNVAGQTLLRLVARANTIIAELLRLSEYIPKPFLKATKADIQKYRHIVIDFSYLAEGSVKSGAKQGPDYYEKVIEENRQGDDRVLCCRFLTSVQKLQELDNEFKETYIKKLKRFYTLFEVIWKYGKDFSTYIEDIENSHYIQMTLEGILIDTDGKQLLAEALYLFGVMLLLLDKKIDGVVRERLLISYLRYTGQNELENLTNVANLIERTGFSKLHPTNKHIPGYPEKYFQRIQMPKNAINMIIGRLRSDDVYNQIPAYPLPQHRSVALASQASMLYVCLYFSPRILYSEEATMREIVDKHFPDNWVIPMYLGYTVDLTVKWEQYPAARLALANTTQPKLVAQFAMKAYRSVTPLLKQLNFYLEDGTMTEEYILIHRVKLLKCLRQANVTLRWLMLHSRRSTLKMRELFSQTMDQDVILMLLLKTAQYEFVLKQQINGILSKKKEKFEEGRKESLSRINDLENVYAGKISLVRVEKNERLVSWLNTIGKQIEILDYEDKTVTGRNIQNLMTALEEVAPFHGIETNIPVQNTFNETRIYLEKMLRLLNVGEDVMIIIDVVSDIAYARELIYSYIPEMQNRIRKDPGSVILLRSTFLKLASILQIPLVRISSLSTKSESSTRDLVVVSEYYSKELVNFVRTVLHIIPEMMFKILAQIIDIQTNKFREIPMRVEKEKIEMYAQLDTRFSLAQKTYRICKFTAGILALETTLVGIIQVEPQQLLEEGIRKILVGRITNILDTTIRFDSQTVDEFEKRLRHLKKVLDGLKRSFNYIQDYVNIYGLKIWQEEIQRIINYNTEQECNMFLNQVHESARSKYQSKIIPIPEPIKIPNDPSNNFIGRLGRSLIRHTDVRKTIYLHSMSGWYSRDQKEVVGLRTFDLLISSVGSFGVSGLDRFFGFSVVKDLQLLIEHCRQIQIESKGKLAYTLRAIVKRLTPLTSIPEGGSRFYLQSMKETARFEQLTLGIAFIGQKQLLRRQLGSILRFKSQLESNALYCALETMNRSLMNEVQAHYRNPEKPYPGPDNPVFFELSQYLEKAGLADPFKNIFVTTDPIIDLPALLFFVLLRQTSHFEYGAVLGQPPKSKRDALDDGPFAVGMATILHQFHSQNLHQFLGLVGQYIRTLLVDHFNKSKVKILDYPPEVCKMLLFLESYHQHGWVEKVLVEQYVPPYVFSEFNRKV